MVKQPPCFFFERRSLATDMRASKERCDPCMQRSQPTVSVVAESVASKHVDLVAEERRRPVEAARNAGLRQAAASASPAVRPPGKKLAARRPGCRRRTARPEARRAQTRRAAPWSRTHARTTAGNK